jgi:hypothetical protein
MAFVLADRVKETTSYTGSGGSILLSGAVTGFQTFSSGVGVGNYTTYAIVNATGSEWEVGFGQLSGASTLTRSQVISSSTGSAVNFSAGVKNIFVTQPAAQQFNAYDQTFTYELFAEDTSAGVISREIKIPAYGSPSYYSSHTLSGTTTSSSAGMSSTGVSAITGDPRTASLTSSVVENGLFKAPNANVTRYLSANGADWNYSSGATGYYTSYAPYSADASGGYTSSVSGVRGEYFQAYNRIPSFSAWDAPGSTLPVIPGTIVVGDADTGSPKFYRRNSSNQWRPFGVAKISGGPGIVVTNNGIGDVGIRTTPVTTPGWYNYVYDDYGYGNQQIAMPSDFSILASAVMISGFSLGGSWGPSPGSWSYTGIASFGVTYLDNPVSSLSSPVYVSNTAGYAYIGILFVIYPSVYSNSSYFLVYAPYSPGSFTGANVVAGGWPVLGTGQHGFGVVRCNGGDYTNTLTATNCTILDYVYCAPLNCTDIYFTGNSSQVNLWSASNPILNIGSSASHNLVLWYTYT